MSVASKLDAEEPRSGNGLRYSAVQIQNGSERESKGKVQREGGELRAEIVQPGSPPNLFVLPPPTLMPWPPSTTWSSGCRPGPRPSRPSCSMPRSWGDVFLIDVAEQEAAQVRAARRPDKPVTMPPGNRGRSS